MKIRVIPMEKIQEDNEKKVHQKIADFRHQIMPLIVLFITLLENSCFLSLLFFVDLRV